MRTSWINSAGSFLARSLLVPCSFLARSSLVPRSFLARSSPRSFDMLGGASSSVVVRCSWLLVRLPSRPVLLASCLSFGLSSGAPSSYLLAIRSVLSSYRSAPRSFDKGGGANAVCVSVWVRFGRCCLLLVVAGPVGCGGAVPLVGVAHVRRVDGVGGRRDFRRSRCLPWAILSVWRVSLVPLLASIVVVGRHGLIVIGCCRRCSVSSSSVVVARRRHALLALGGVIIRIRSVGHPPLIVSLIVSPLLVLSSRLACREAGRLAARVFSCSVRLVAWGAVLLAPLGSRGGGSSYPSACLPLRGPTGGALPLAWRVVAAFPPSPVARAACLCG